MRGCIGFPSVAGLAAWSGDNVSSDFPAQNLSDLLNVRAIAAAATPGAASFVFTLPGPISIQLITLIHHNLSPGATVRVRLFDNLTGAGAPSGSYGTFGDPPAFALAPSFPPSLYGVFVLASSIPVLDMTVSAQAQVYESSTLPILLANPTVTGSGRLDITPASGADAVQIGAVDLAGAYLFNTLQVQMSRGFATTSQRTRQPGGIDASIRQWSPRTFSGSVGVLDAKEIETTFLDMQSACGLANPFVWVRDIDDQATWPREAFLCRNASIPLANTSEAFYGSPTLDLKEHLG